jgi:hypothetical protein
VLPDPAVPAGEIWVVFIRSPDYAAALSRAARLADVNAGLVEVSVTGTRGFAEAKFCFATDDREGYACLIAGRPPLEPVTRRRSPQRQS